MARADKIAADRSSVTAVGIAASNDNGSGGTTAVLAVENMHCGACMRAVEIQLSNLPGVASARANLSTHRVKVDFEPARVSITDLIDALDGVGFRAADLDRSSLDASGQRDSDLLKRLAVAGFAAANIMLLSVAVWAGHAGDIDASLMALLHWLSALIALPVVAWSGQPFFRSAAAALKGRRLNMDVPISLAITLATLMSTFQTLRGGAQVYFDAAVTLLFFLLIGRYLDSRMRSRASGIVTNLLSLRSGTALVLGADGKQARLSARELQPGMRILVAAGERILADGILRAGASQIDESLITGESLPKHAAPGHQLYSGAVNLSAPIEMETTATDDLTLLAEIARLVSAAEQARGRYVQLADRAARIYAPAVHGLGLATFLIWLLLGAGPEAALLNALAVLIITCPCALALAVPAVQVAAASRLFAKGIIVKAPDGLERLAEVDTVVFDKTGTLTLGEPQPMNESAIADDVLRRAAALALSSRHPYSRAIVKAARNRQLELAVAADVTEVPGCGLSRKTEQDEERLGSAAFVDAPSEGEAALWYRAGDGAFTRFCFEDRLRSDASPTVRALLAAGYAVEILSGDREESVAKTAREAGIECWRAEQKPDAKIGRLTELAAHGRKTLMVGDGLNDAPSLAKAHASLSPASAADITQTAADAIFQGDKLGPVIEALAVAKRSRRMSLQNFGIALAYNAVCVPLAMCGQVTPLIAAIAMSASSIAVTANAVRLRTARVAL